MCLTYFGLGDHEEESIRQLLAYYAFIAERAEWVAKSAARSADEVRARIDAFREIGADELIFSARAFPTWTRWISWRTRPA